MTLGKQNITEEGVSRQLQNNLLNLEYGAEGDGLKSHVVLQSYWNTGALMVKIVRWSYLIPMFTSVNCLCSWPNQVQWNISGKGIYFCPSIIIIIIILLKTTSPFDVQSFNHAFKCVLPFLVLLKCEFLKTNWTQQYLHSSNLVAVIGVGGLGQHQLAVL